MMISKNKVNKIKAKKLTTDLFSLKTKIIVIFRYQNAKFY